MHRAKNCERWNHPLRMSVLRLLQGEHSRAHTISRLSHPPNMSTFLHVEPPPIFTQTGVTSYRFTLLGGIPNLLWWTLYVLSSWHMINTSPFWWRRHKNVPLWLDLFRTSLRWRYACILVTACFHPSIWTLYFSTGQSHKSVNLYNIHFTTTGIT